MDTTITEVKYVEFVECADRNYFLRSIFPSGLGDVLVGQFGLDRGQFYLNIHVFEKPDKDIKKWGVWGVNYDVIVINLLGERVNDIKIQNWERFTTAPLLCWFEKERLFINCQSGDQIFEISCAGVIFQSCSTYIR